MYSIEALAMRVSTILPLSALLISVLASPYVVHEKRHERTDERWSKLTLLDASEVVPIRIGLKQQNLEHGENWLMNISDPASPHYGKHWNARQVIDAFKPRYVTISHVTHNPEATRH